MALRLAVRPVLHKKRGRLNTVWYHVGCPRRGCPGLFYLSARSTVRHFEVAPPLCSITWSVGERRSKVTDVDPNEDLNLDLVEIVF